MWGISPQPPCFAYFRLVNYYDSPRIESWPWPSFGLGLVMAPKGDHLLFLIPKRASEEGTALDFWGFPAADRRGLHATGHGGGVLPGCGLSFGGGGAGLPTQVCLKGPLGGGILKGGGGFFLLGGGLVVCVCCRKQMDVMCFLFHRETYTSRYSYPLIESNSKQIPHAPRCRGSLGLLQREEDVN